MRRVAAILTGLALGLGATACDRLPSRERAAPSIRIGGPFHLVDQDGRAVTERDLLGKPTAIFFGFTFCPEVCPTTLTEMTRWLDELGPDANRLNVVFVSVDPKRDTPAALKRYLSNFDPRIRGFTGSEADIAQAAKAYRIYYAKVPLEGGEYTMDHTSTVFLFDARGGFVAPISYGAPHERGLAALRRLLDR